MFDVKKMGERIKALRGTRTQAECAELLGISRGALSFYENGERKPDADVLYEMSEKFGVSADYLLGLSTAQKRNSDLTAACNYTGLSEETVKTISSYFKPRKRMASEIIKSDEFLRIIDIFLNAQSHKEFLQPSGEAIAIALMARINSIKDAPALNDIPPVFIDALSVIGSNGLEPMYKQQIFDEMTVLFEKIIESGD